MRWWSATPAAMLAALFPFVARAEDDAEDADDGEAMIVVEPPIEDARPAPPQETRVDRVAAAPKVPRYVDVSYASQTLLLDGAAVAMFAFGVATDVQPLPGLGILTYGFGPPIVHFSHGNVGKGFADMGIRVISPFLFALPGLMGAIVLTDRSDRETRERAMDIGGFTGMALGAAFAMAVDALVLAKDRVPEERAYFRDDASREGRGTRASASSARPASAHP